MNHMLPRNHYAKQLSELLLSTLQACQPLMRFPVSGYPGKPECDAAAAILAFQIKEWNYSPGREVIYCTMDGTGRTEVAVIAKGLSQIYADMLNENIRMVLDHSSYDPFNALEKAGLQVQMAADTDWPERTYASGKPDARNRFLPNYSRMTLG